jgi:hypothetical protein
MQRNEWLGLILMLVLIVLWVEARERGANEPPFVCARDAGERMLVPHLAGSSARRCTHGAVGHLSDASSGYPAARVP